MSQPQQFQQDTSPRRYTDAPTFLDRHGYVWEWCPSHPMANRGMVSQHRLIVECSLGRFLSKQERVHHVNHDRSDNRVCNLELHASASEHMAQHWASTGKRDPLLIAAVRAAADDPSVPLASFGVSPTTLRALCQENGIVLTKRDPVRRLTDEDVKAALQGRTTREAARILGCHVMTLYNRFDHLLKKRTSPGSLEPHREEVLRLVRKERLSHADVAVMFGVSEPTVHKNVQRWSAEEGVPAPRFRPWESSRAASKLDAKPDAVARRRKRQMRREQQLQRTEPNTGE